MILKFSNDLVLTHASCHWLLLRCSVLLFLRGLVLRGLAPPEKVYGDIS